MKFDRLAPFYGIIEALANGGKMQRCRLAQLAKVPEATRILLVGEGNGQFLAACAGVWPAAEITVLDESPSMLRRARRAWKQAGGIGAKFVCTDLLNWQPEGQPYDLVITHFFLDCFAEAQLAGVLSKIASAAAPNARWLLADFCEPAGGLAGLRARARLALAYAIFRQLAAVPAHRLIPPDPYLAALGFVLQNRRISDWGMMHSDLWRRKDRLPAPSVHIA